MAADRTVPCDHSIKRILLEGRECNRVVCCSTPPRLQPNGQILLNYTKVILQGEEGAHRGETSSIALKVRPPDSPRSREEQEKVRMFPGFSFWMLRGHQAEFGFDVRQFGVSQRARLHFSTPVLLQSS